MKVQVVVVEEFSLELRARDRERKLLRKIDKSLKRLSDEEYGFCEACGIEIGIRRLEARPTAELCIDCKQLQEKKEKSWVWPSRREGRVLIPRKMPLRLVSLAEW